MKIGFDLDHTLIDYRQLMNQVAWDEGLLEPPHRNKIELRNKLVLQYGQKMGETHWQWIQAQIYGLRINEAHLYPGVFDCLLKLRDQGHELVIVSHKTRTSNAHPTISFWEPTLEFLNGKKFFCQDGLGFSRQDIFFETTRESKCKRIQDLGLDMFVDDLESVLSHSEFPQETKKVLFGQSSNHLSLLDWQDFPHLCLCMELNPALELNLWKRLNAGGNHSVYEAKGPKEHILVKHMHLEPGDNRPRFQAEKQFYLLGLGRQWPIPKILAAEPPLILTEFVDHKDEKVEMEACMSFLLRLAEEKWTVESKIPFAADARFSASEFVLALKNRLNQFKDTELPASFKSDINLKMQAISRMKEWDFDRTLCFLSPSDFGPHNAFVSHAGETLFIDFEYAGWDDPAKLMADFFWHAGFDWTKEVRWKLMETFINYRREKDPKLPKRLHEVIPWVGLEWVCIVLNVYHPNFLLRKRERDPKCDIDQLMKSRIVRAKTKLANFDLDCKWIQNRLGAYL